MAKRPIGLDTTAFDDGTLWNNGTDLPELPVQLERASAASAATSGSCSLPFDQGGSSGDTLPNTLLNAAIIRVSASAGTALSVDFVQDSPAGTYGSGVITEGGLSGSMAVKSNEGYASSTTGLDGSTISLTPTLTIAWAGVNQSQAGGWNPPDCNIAAGVNNVITVVNDHIDIYSKSGASLYSQSMNAFFSVPTSNFVFDPRVMWDQFSGRFIVIADDRTGANSHVHIAVSVDSNPVDGWYNYDFSFKNGNSWIDYPILGLDSSSIYVAGNYFDLTSGAYTFSGVWAINKGNLEIGAAATAYLYTSTSLGAPYSDLYTPAHMYGMHAGLSGDFFVEYGQNNSGNDTLRIERVENAAAGTANFNIQTLNAGNISDAFPLGARQPGTSTLIDDGDWRIQDAVWRGDKLYAVTEIRVGSGASAHDVVHWFVVDTSKLNALTLLSQGNIDYGTDYDTYYGNLTVDSSGNMIIGYSFSGPGTAGNPSHPPVYASSVYAVIPAGGTSLADGGAYLTSGQGVNTGGRWGDYSGIAIDPTDDKSFWVFNEYATSSNSWGTTVGGFQAVSPDTTPPSLVHEGSISVAAGATAAIPSSQLQFDDNVSTHAQETYTVINAPTHGTLLKNGSATSSFTQADIDNGLIAYHEVDSNVSSDAFTFRVTDAAGNQTTGQQFQFQISAATLRIVDVIPNSDSAESGQNSEPSLAVNPLDATQIIAGTFGAGTPYFKSLNGGTTWFDYGNLNTQDKSLAWKQDGSAALTTTLLNNQINTYLGSIGGGNFGFPINTFDPGHDVDQPWVRTGPSNHVYVGYNDLDADSGKTATVLVSTNGGTSYTPVTIDRVGGAAGQDAPSIRLAVDGNTVYSVFTRWNSVVDNNIDPNTHAGEERYTSQVIVVRSDNGGADGFAALGANGNGVQVGTPTSLFMFFGSQPNSVGQERAGGDVAIAVDPNDVQHVVLAYGDAPGARSSGFLQLHVTESTNGGATWTDKFTTSSSTRSAEPGLSILSGGAIGLLYDNYNPTTDKLSQHMLTTSDDFATTTDTILATESNSTPASQFSPYVGDFFDLTSVGNTFYGIFSASNADNGADAQFSNITFQRNFLGAPGTSSFRLTDGSGNTVAASIDPFFFSFQLGNNPGVVSINDVSIAEGDSGTRQLVFTVTRAGGTAAFDLNYATSDGSATTADSDYIAKSGTLHFADSVNTQTISITINGDTKIEPDENFLVNLSGPTNGATLSDNQGIGTITNDDQPLAGSVSISDASISEGNTGSKLMTFTVTRSGGTAAFSVNFATANGSATIADGDYDGVSGTLNFGASVNTQTVFVTIHGDTKVEPDETFFVNLSAATNGATIGDGQAIGTIINDDNTLPDLTAANLAVSNTAPHADDSETVNYQIKNVGSSAAGGFYAGVYVSDDATVTTSDYLLGFQFFGSLAAGSSISGSVTGTLSNGLLPGKTYYVGVIADDLNGVAESNESNNLSNLVQITVPVQQKPDFNIYYDPTLSASSVVQGDFVQFSYYVTNWGGNSAPSTSGIYLSTNSTISTADTLLTTDAVAAITGGGFGSPQHTVAISTTPFAPGTYYLGVIADYNNAVAESDETNNASIGVAITVTAPPQQKPDLDIYYDPTLSASSVVQGDFVQFSYYVTNWGANSGASTSGIYLSTNSTISAADTLLTTDAVAAITGGGFGSPQHTVSISTTPFAPGTYYLGVIADYNNAVAESDETNNASIGVAITVRAPTPSHSVPEIDPGAYTDLGGDGRSDIILHNQNGQVAIWEMNGAQVKTAQVIGAVGLEWHIESTGDFTGDGIGDVVWRSNDGTVSAWQMNGPHIGTASTVGLVGTEWHIQGTGDLDGNGGADLVWRNDAGVLMLWTLNGTHIQAVQFFGAVGQEWHIAGIADFGGDNRDDILWRRDDGTVLMFQMNGTQIQRSDIVGATGTEWHIEGTPDLNGDGRADILFRSDSGSVGAWLMNGAQLQAPPAIGARGTDWHIYGTGDFNGDGKDDILWRNDNGTVDEWLMNGNQVVSNPTITQLALDWTLGVHHYDFV